MSCVQLALRVPDLNASVAFCSKLFGTERAELRDGYADFAMAEPPLKLVLVEGATDEVTRVDHLCVEIESESGVAVRAATTRLGGGLAADVENDSICCYALQDEVWVHGPGQAPWEVYVVQADADFLAKQQGSTCCTTGPADAAVEVGAKEPSVAGGAADAPMADHRTSGAWPGRGTGHGPRLPAAFAPPTAAFAWRCLSL